MSPEEPHTLHNSTTFIFIMIMYYIWQLEPQSVVGISGKAARSVLGDWASKKHDEDWQSIRVERQAGGLLKGPCT